MKKKKNRTRKKKKTRHIQEKCRTVFAPDRKFYFIKSHWENFGK
jgi:hypothetical protein